MRVVCIGWSQPDVYANELKETHRQELPLVVIVVTPTMRLYEDTDGG